MSNIEDDIKLLEKFAEICKEEGEALERILAELEQKDKRIQEMEEENKKKSIELICYQEELDNSIPEQAIKDKIEKLKNDYDQKYDLYMGYKVESREQQDILKQMSILQELLEGEK